MKYLYMILIFFLLQCFACKIKEFKQLNSIEKTVVDYLVNYKATDNIKGKHIVLISGDEEYRSEEALPQLAKILTKRHGFDCTVLFAQHPDTLGVINPNYTKNIPGDDSIY